MANTIPTVPNYTGDIALRSDPVNFPANAEAQYTYQALLSEDLNVTVESMNVTGAEVESNANAAASSASASANSAAQAQDAASTVVSIVLDDDYLTVNHTFNLRGEVVNELATGYLWKPRGTVTLPYTTDIATYPLASQDPNLAQISAINELETVSISVGTDRGNVSYDGAGETVVGYIYSPDQSTTYSVPSGAQGKLIDSVIVDVLTTDDAQTYQLIEREITGKYTQPVGDSYTMDEYLGNKGIFAATEQKIQDANDYIVSTGKRTKITLPESATIPIVNGLLIDTSFVTLDGNFSTFDCSGMTVGQAIQFTGTVAPPYKQAKDCLNNLDLIGPGASSNVGSILFSAPNSVGGEGPSHTVMNNVTTNGFGVGEEYGDRAYLTTANNCDILNCGVALKGSVANDGGENMRRFGGAIYNSALAIEMNNPNGTFSLFGASIDYCNKIAAITNGQVYANGCHVEAEDYQSTPITIDGNGACMNVSGGWWLLSGLSTKSFDHWVDAADETSFRMHLARMNNTRTATDEFATGDGFVSLDALSSYDVHGNCNVLHASKSKLIDGGFELASIVDDVYLTEDTQPITDRHTGTNVKISLSGALPKSGAKSLAYQKSFGGGSLSKFTLISVPITTNQQVGGRFYLRKPAGTSTGSISITYSFAKVVNNELTIPATVHKETQGDLTVTLTTGDTGWVEVVFNPTVWKAPHWATHFIVEVNGFAWGGLNEFIYFDDLTVDIVG